MTFRNILDPAQNPGTLQGKFATAVVIDNNDPMKLQRIKARVSEMHSGRPPEEITWAIQFKYSDQGSAAGLGSMGVPVIGAKVWLMFPEDDEHDIYYIADFHDKSNQIAELLIDYPHVYGRIDASGNIFLVNTLRDTVLFTHLSGSTILFSQNGDINIFAAGKLNFFSIADINMRAGGNINMDGTDMYLNSGTTTTQTITPRTKPSAITPPDNSY